jgi:hypothetical protein
MSREKLIHIWSRCHHCGQAPIEGPRYHCETCRVGPETDLCISCYALYSKGRVPHPSASDPFRAVRHNFVAIEGAPLDSHVGWLAPPMPNVRPPKLTVGSIVRPEFFYRTASSFGAYASVVAAGSQALAITGLHVLDEVAKKCGVDTTTENTAYTGEELPRVITRLNLYDALEEKWVFHCLGAADAMLVLPNARSNVEEPLAYRDIAAFVVRNDARVKRMVLARAAPEVGAPVWLAARFGCGPELREAVVVEKTAESFVFRFSDRSQGSKYTSGAPILNADGEAVAINIGAGCLEGHRLGHAIHAESIHSHLSAGYAQVCVS